jgi:hypothetical protein
MTGRSEGYEAVKLGRKFVGIELKASYWAVARDNLDRAELEVSQPTLLDDLLDLDDDSAAVHQ